MSVLGRIRTIGLIVESHPNAGSEIASFRLLPMPNLERVFRHLVIGLARAQRDPTILLAARARRQIGGRFG